MNYERRKKEVQALKLAASIFDVDGKPLAKKGDYLVIENGKQYYMTEAEFTEEFQPKREVAKEYWPVPYPVYPRRYPYYDGWTWVGTGAASTDTILLSAQKHAECSDNLARYMNGKEVSLDNSYVSRT